MFSKINSLAKFCYQFIVFNIIYYILMFIADSQYFIFCYVLCDLNHVFNLLNIDKLLSQDTDVLGCTINTLISFIVSIQIINIIYMITLLISANI